MLLIFFLLIVLIALIKFICFQYLTALCIFQEVLKEFDTENGEVDFPTFLAVLAKNISEEEWEEENKRIFQV